MSPHPLSNVFNFQHPRAPAHENAAARDASDAAARGWARSQSSRVREKARRLEAGEAPSAESQPRSSASVAGDSSSGSNGANSSGGGGSTAPMRTADGSEDGGGGGGDGGGSSGGLGMAADGRTDSGKRHSGQRDEGPPRDGDRDRDPHSSEDEGGFPTTAGGGQEEGGGGVASMHVVKRDGRREPVMFDKITARIRRLCWGLDERYIDPVLVAQKVGVAAT